MDPETRVFQAANGEDLKILASTVFDRSTRVTDRWTDGQTELQWLRHATAIAGVEHNEFLKILNKHPD